MSSDNPHESSPDLDKPQTETISAERAAYNVVSDIAIGVNVRKSDNTFQAVFVLATVIALAAGGAILAALNADWGLPWFGGAMIGGFAGLVLGVLASGLVLMVYRAVRHIQGKHE